MAEFESRLAGIPGLHVAGNAYQGIGVPDCIRMGRSAAERIAAA
jgi:oxygen-dependent protoporphyrinogen oxidase